jgi:AraC family cel operon transcriptional repressor
MENKHKLQYKIFSKKEDFPLRNSDEYLMLYMISGECNQTINGKMHEFIEDSYVLVRPNERYEMVDILPNTVILGVQIRGDEMEKILSFFGGKVKSYVQKNKSILSVCGDFNVKYKVDEIYERIQKHGDDDGILRHLFALEIVTGIIRKMHRKKMADEIPERLVRALDEMRKVENLREGVPALERLTHYSRPQLCRIIKKCYGLTPLEYVTNIRLNFAYNFIKYSGMAYEIVAEQVGYQSTSYFFKLFKKKFGITPSKLRSESLKK